MGRGLEAYGALVLRIFLGVIYMAHAYLALFVMGPAKAIDYQRALHIPLPEIGAWYLIFAHGLGGL
ncbi:MAG TPA: DoxX family membrane protein, partial [Candidatus Acidoferrales bacterium]|nr:DoxX family membrane protein [Candidatus Acidoferrales bacterium]